MAIYKGLTIADSPTGAGGIALNNDFTTLADRAPYIAGFSPGASNDNTQGFAAGSLWFNTASLAIWTCVSAGTSAAVWTPIIQSDQAAGILVAGTTKSVAYKVGAWGFEKTLNVTFPAGAANQKVDLYWTGTFWGWFDVNITSDFADQPAMGVVTKRFALGTIAGTIYGNFSKFTEVQGNLPANFTISDVTWDATNSRYRIQLVHRVSTLNQLSIQIKGTSTDDNYTNAILGAALSSVYTTDTTTFPFPGVYGQAAVSQTSDIHQWRDSSNNVLVSVGKGGALSGSMDTMTYAATISLDVALGNLHKVTATGNATINASAGGVAGQHMWVLVVNDATAARTITFGTNFKSSGTLVGTTSKSATVQFVSDGSSWYEVGRTTGL